MEQLILLFVKYLEDVYYLTNNDNNDNNKKKTKQETISVNISYYDKYDKYEYSDDNNINTNI